MKSRFVSLLLSILLLFVVAPLLQAAGPPPPPSFTKLDAAGKELPREAKEWAMVRDNNTGLIWENKTTDGSIHDQSKTFDWDGAHDVFLAELNGSKFGGFSDWRMPTTDELNGLTVEGAEPFIDQDYFSNTEPTGYLSWRKCGSGEIFPERVKFGSVRNTKGDRRVRAVRGGEAK